MLIYQLLAQMCAAEPKTMQDVEANVMQSFAHPINLWCLRDAQDKMERYAVRKRGVFIFPMEKLFHQLQKVCASELVSDYCVVTIFVVFLTSGGVQV